MTLVTLLGILSHLRTFLSTLPPGDKEWERKIRSEIQLVEEVIEELDTDGPQIDLDALMGEWSEKPDIVLYNQKQYETGVTDPKVEKFLSMLGSQEAAWRELWLGDLRMSFALAEYNAPPKLVISSKTSVGGRGIRAEYNLTTDECPHCSLVAGVPVVGHTHSGCPVIHGGSLKVGKTVHRFSPQQCRALVYSLGQLAMSDETHGGEE